MLKWFAALSLLLLLCMLLGLAVPVSAQIQEPDDTFQIDQIEAYQNCYELEDQLYLISFTCEYDTSPSILIDDAFIFRLISGNTTLGTTTAYGFFDSGYDSGIAALYFSAADAPAWAGAYKVEMAGNPTLQWLDNTANTTMTGAYASANVTLTDETTESNSAAAGDMTLFTASPSTDDAYYFGSSGMFNILTLTISQQGAWAGSYSWEYWDGDEWVTLSDISDASTGFTTGTGTYDITFTCPTDWQENIVGTTSAYWVRLRITAFTSVTTQPLGTQSWTNTLANPPSTESNVFSLWFDEDSLVETEDRLTGRLRTVATLLENDWGIVTDLIESTASGKKLTDDGEDYFVNTIPNLRDICPELFSASLATPDFPEDTIVEDNLMGGEDSFEDTNLTTTWFAQTFTASAEYYINGVWLKMARTGVPGNITVGLRSTVANLPTGADLLTGTDNASAYTSDDAGSWYQVVFTDHYLLTNGTAYAIVIRTTGGGVGATDFSTWLKDSNNGEETGQASTSLNSGVLWEVLDVGVSDFLYGTTGTNVLSMSLRDRLAQRLVGTRLDMTNLAVQFNTTRMWVSTIVWFGICIGIAVAACLGAKSYKPATLIIAFLMPFGSLVGFIYLEISILMAMIFAAVSVFILFYRGASA